MELNTLEELYLSELRDIYNAESQLLKALPKMAKAASSRELRSAFEEHLEETKGQIQRLESIFQELDESPKGKKCKGMQGLIEEGEEMIEEAEDPDVRDAGLISAAQRVEHYEIAAYGCVRTYARLLKHNDQADLLQESLDEEGDTDQKLTEISQSINVEANEGNGDDEAETVPPRRSNGNSKRRTNGR